MRNTGLKIGFVAAASLVATGCGSKDGKEGGSLSNMDKVEAIASTLQACSYDGRPVDAASSSLNGPAPNECAVAVKQIMGFTGLPANFVVVSGPVDNAAAAILLDQNKVPRRVIAFNPKFMSEATARVGGDRWGPISVMAHEIAHHLSGHTIVPGGSRPAIELEADKFSGFVLQKMGASLPDATKMILAVGTDHGTPTHPDKRRRASAITEGWRQSCTQSGGQNCDGSDVARPGAAPSPSSRPAASATRALPSILPQPGTVPFKYGRFVIDETGKLDSARSKAMEQKLYALSRDSGVEFTVIVANDLRGMSAEDYAWAMMRQLRVGKLDVGNGAVAVVAPKQRQAAVAFGPGFAKEAEFSDPKKQLIEWSDAAWRYCDDADGCGNWTDNLFNIFRLTLSNAERTKWTIRYQTLGDLLDHYSKVNAERLRTKREFNPQTDQPLGNLLRLSGRITSLKAPAGMGQVNERLLGGALGYTAVTMTTDDGYPVILYVSSRMAALMPAGKLKENQRYTLVGRLQRSGDRDKQAPALWLFSYDPL